MSHLYKSFIALRLMYLMKSNPPQGIHSEWKRVCISGNSGLNLHGRDVFNMLHELILLRHVVAFHLQEICSLCFRCIRKSNSSFRRAMWWIYIQLHRAKVSPYLYYYAWVWHKYSKLCEQYSVTINWLIFQSDQLIWYKKHVHVCLGHQDCWTALILGGQPTV